MYTEGVITYLAGEALATRRRVKIESGTVTSPPEVIYADAGEAAVGVTEAAALIGGLVSVRPVSMNGNLECVAGAAIATAVNVYAAVDGKVSGAVSGSIIGQAASAAGADGDHILVARIG